jgi:aryl-alcohol dehydrogenase-like predicted oxidoreductase
MTTDLTPRRLTKDLSVNPLAVGCWAIGGPTVNSGSPIGWSTNDDARSLEGLRRSIALGADLFDTADVYGHGHSERLLGQVLRECDREALTITSKVGFVPGTAPHSYATPRLRHQFEQSCQNLGTDYLDAYFLHNMDFGEDDRYLSDAIDQIRALRDAGFIRAIGMRGPQTLGSDRPDAADIRTTRFLKIFRLVRPDLLWIRFNPLSPPPLVDGEDIFSFTARQGVGLLLSEPLAQGLLTGKYDPAHPPSFALGDHRRHKVWFTEPGLTVIDAGLQLLRERFGPRPEDLTRVALRFSLQQADHTAVLAGFTTPQQVTANHACLGQALTGAELDYAEAVYAQIREGLDAVGDRYRIEVPA